VVRPRDATEDQHAAGEATTSSKHPSDARTLPPTNSFTDTGLDCCTSCFRCMFARNLSQPSFNPWARFAIGSPEQGGGT
jgi:hypothetical protein